MHYITFKNIIVIFLYFVIKCVAFEFEGYGGPMYSTKQCFYTASSTGNHWTNCLINSYRWYSDYGTTCVKMCDEYKETGIWCVDHDDDDVPSEYQFNHIHIWKTGDNEPDC